MYGPVICAFTVCSPPASHTTPHSWFHLKPLSYLLIGLLCPKCIVGSTLGLFHSLRPLRMCCFVLHGTVHSLRPPVHSCPSPHWSTELRDPAWSRDPRALRSAARGAGSAASAGGSAFALVPCSGTCHMISHVTGIYNVRCMVSILKEKRKQEELQQD